MRKIVLLLLVISNLIVSAQQAKSNEKEDLIKMMMFESLKMSFPHDAAPASNTLKSSYVFPWVGAAKVDSSKMKAELSGFASKYELKFDGENLILFSSFSANFDADEKYMSIDVVDQKLKNESGAIVELNARSNSVYLSTKVSITDEFDADGNVTGAKEVAVAEAEKIYETETAFKNLNGTLTVVTKYLTSYDYKKITASDIGKVLVFGSNKIKVLSIKENVFTYELIEGDGEFKHFATNANDVPYRDNVSRSKVSQQDIDFVTLHPNFTQEDVNQYYTSIKDLLTQKKIEKNIYVVRYDGTVSNVYFYKPAAFISETSVVKVEL